MKPIRLKEKKNLFWRNSFLFKQKKLSYKITLPQIQIVSGYPSFYMKLEVTGTCSFITSLKPTFIIMKFDKVKDRCRNFKGVVRSLFCLSGLVKHKRSIVQNWLCAPPR